MSKQVSEGSDRNKEWFSKRNVELKGMFIERKNIDYEILMNFSINILSAELFNHIHPTHFSIILHTKMVFL